MEMKLCLKKKWKNIQIINSSVNFIHLYFILMDNREYLKKLEDPTYLPSREEIFQQCRE